LRMCWRRCRVLLCKILFGIYHLSDDVGAAIAGVQSMSMHD
jgi:hypothetical protein